MGRLNFFGRIEFLFQKTSRKIERFLKDSALCVSYRILLLHRAAETDNSGMRLRLQFGLRTLLIGVTIFCIAARSKNAPLPGT